MLPNSKNTMGNTTNWMKVFREIYSRTNREAS